MKNREKKPIAMLLCMVMCISLLPVSALAEEKTEETGVIETASEGRIEAADIVVEEWIPALEEEVIFSIEEEEPCVSPTVEIGEANLLDGYAAQQLYAPLQREKLRGQKTNGDKLTGRDHEAYTHLKQDIALVASGNETSTVFSYSFEDFGVTQTTWTAEELGVESIIYVDDEGNKKITSEAKTAAVARVSIDLASVLNALLLDCPYELYWYDKTEGTSREAYGFSASIKTSGDTITIKNGYTFSFSVASAYQGDEAYTVTTVYSDMILNAVANAGEIVAACSEYADHEKLTAYKNSICDLVSYNHEAVDDDWPYGNPWQIIWVFDGDTETNVVCEGYAKAFQYLCDLTAFDYDGITAYCVSGVMSGGGDHMWNIVAMDDGKNYMVDVTNCDTGTIGYPNRLFLAGYISGSVNNGYVFAGTSQPITYTYDEETREIYTDDELTIARCSYQSHTFNEPVWTWIPDFSYAVAAFLCTRCGDTQTVEAVISSETGETSITYTAAVTLNGIEYTDTRTVEVSPRISGDVNGDGTVDGRDLVRLKQFFAGYETAIDESNADANGDSVVDGRDAILLAQYFAGYDVELN